MGGEQFTSKKLEITCGNGKATLDEETLTVTLNNASVCMSGVHGNVCAAMYSGVNLNVVLSGSNQLNAGCDVAGGAAGGYSQSAGLFCRGDLTVSGEGTLQASGGFAKYSRGVSAGGSISISGGTVTAEGGVSDSGSSFGVFAGGNVNISGGEVDAAGGRQPTQGGGYSRGIHANGTIAVSGGEVAACGGKAFGKAPDLSGYPYPHVMVSSGGSGDPAEWDGSTALGGSASPYTYVTIDSLRLYDIYVGGEQFTLMCTYPNRSPRPLQGRNLFCRNV